jgi:uncharacterized membrane protein
MYAGLIVLGSVFLVGLATMVVFIRRSDKANSRRWNAMK